ncbi:uncharacterized protein LOC118281098 [Spodoptera frugiperda]|uniref:Uncharacterized protein LOC118281098 n=1 Tax=Spodoptera frugiperda TaxID=7108 RepID=A0A9R0F110_SPOFR|nr:uncharacterized protein LOC118281098 [Spodoptera frugiperda]
MYRSERWPEEEPPSRRSSRRSSGGSAGSAGSSGRRASLSPPAAASPRRSKPQHLDFLVSGKQILKKSDRASSLPGAYHRRLSAEGSKPRKLTDSPRRAPRAPPAPANTRDTSLEDHLSLDLSQIQALATSTPRHPRPQGRSASVQSAPHRMRRAPAPAPAPLEVDYSSVSPEYSGQSSAELSPSRGSRDQLVSSCCVSTWPECSETDTAVDSGGGAGGAGAGARAPCDGEWCSFWANYNNSMPHVPVARYYDQCPTPYRTDTLDLADFSERSPPTDTADPADPAAPPDPGSPRAADAALLADIVRRRGLTLSPRDTQCVIKCAHLLGAVLARAIERTARAPRPRDLRLDLPDPAPPAPPSACATTQTDISLPNTRSAPRIFENILRQLSRSSLDDTDKGEPKPDAGGAAGATLASSDPPSEQ